MSKYLHTSKERTTGQTIIDTLPAPIDHLVVVDIQYMLTQTITKHFQFPPQSPVEEILGRRRVPHVVPQHVRELEILVRGHPPLDPTHLLQRLSQLGQERLQLAGRGAAVARRRLFAVLRRQLGNALRQLRTGRKNSYDENLEIFAINLKKILLNIIFWLITPVHTEIGSSLVTWFGEIGSCYSNRTNIG